MSLRVFHIFFIIISTLCSGFVGFWGFTHESFTLGILCAITSVALFGYLIWFLQKTPKTIPLLLLFLVPKSTWACAVCFGEGDALSKAANQKSILFLLVLTGLVLAGVTAMVIRTIRQADRRHT